MSYLSTFLQRSKNVRLVNFIYTHCNETKRSASYICAYRRLARLIEAFEKEIHQPIFTDAFSDKMIEEYFHFIRSSTPQKEGHQAYRQSTVRQFYQKNISVLNKAKRAGYKVDLSGFNNYHVPDEDSCAVYLTMMEIEKLVNLKLNREQAQVRDIFIIGCCTALRYSDYSHLTEANFHNGNITVQTQKTGAKVTIPIHYFVSGIISRNGGYGFLKYTKSQQNFNNILKRICRKAGIADKILIERTEGFKKIKKSQPKWELVSSHTARRSGATNMYLAKIQPYRIMLITGHKTEAAFYRYIRIQREENAKELQVHPFFKGPLEIRCNRQYEN